MTRKTRTARGKPAPTSREDHSQPIIWSCANSGTFAYAAERRALTTVLTPIDVSSKVPARVSRTQLRSRLCQKDLRFGTPQARLKAFSTKIKTQVEDHATIRRQERTTGGDGFVSSSRFAETKALEPGNSASIV